MSWARALGSLITRPERPPVAELERRLIDAVLAEPDDDAPRMVYADWLCGRPEPVLSARGELITIQCTLEGIADPVEHARLKARDFELVERYGNVWCAYAGLGEARNNWYPAEHEVDFQRGFMETVSMRIGDYPRVAARLFTSEPVRHLRLGGYAPEVMARLPTSIYVRRLRALALRRTRFNAAELGALVSAIANLERLELVDMDLGLDHLAALTPVRALCLHHNGLDANVVAALGPLAEQLEILELDGNPIGDVGAQVLARTPFAKLRRLSLVGVDLDETWQIRLRERFGDRLIT
ncbi:MAG: TIGR02996 domain-containing protein [Kofleriaceae bacterium]